MQGYRNDDIRLVERCRICKYFAIPYPHFGADFGAITVFEVVDDSFYTRRFAEIPVGCYRLDANPAPQLAGTAVLSICMGAGVGEMVPTAGADEFFTVHQWRITSH